MRRQNWDLLRLSAALCVLVIHWQAFNWGLPLRFQLPIDPVPVFVCLSGVLIPESFSNSRSWGHFGWKRFLRVVPAFLVSLLVASFFGGSLRGNLTAYATMGLVLLAGTNNGPLWSLMVEELLYATHVLSRLRKLWSPYVVLFLAIVSGALMIKFSHNMMLNNIFRATEAFFVGNFAYFNLKKIERVSGWWLLIAFVLLRLYVGETRPTWTVIAFTNPTLCILIVMGLRNIPQIRLKFPDLSYGVYVYHAPIVLWAYQTWPKSPATSLLVSLASVFTLCALSWYWIEGPILSLKKYEPRAIWNRIFPPPAKPVLRDAKT